jgi:hypothetical protein
MLKHQDEFIDWGAIPDRNCPFITTGNFNVLLYNMDDDRRILCRVDTKNRKLVQIGSNFQLSPDDFSCLDLNGDVASGLSKSLDTINRYDVRQMKTLDKIKVSGLPASLQHGWETPYRLQVSRTLYNFLELVTFRVVAGPLTISFLFRQLSRIL